MIKKGVLVIIVLLAIGLFSIGIFGQGDITGEDVSTGTFSLENTPPAGVANSLGVGDLGTSEKDATTPLEIAEWDMGPNPSTDDTDVIDTHDRTPILQWEVYDPDPETVGAQICVTTDNTDLGGDGYDTCNVISATITGATECTDLGGGTRRCNYIYNAGDVQTYDLGFTPSVGAVCTATDCAVTFYVHIIPVDGSGANPAGILKMFDQVTITEGFVLRNQIPNVPSAIALDPNNDGVNGPSLSAPLETHSQTPTVSWTATDNDDGLSRNRWPEDTLTGHLEVADDDLDTGAPTTWYENNAAADPAGTVVDDVPIPWSTTPTGTDDRTATPVYAKIWTTDEHDADDVGVAGRSADYFPASGAYAPGESFALVDYLPDVTLIEICGLDAATEGPLTDVHYNDCDGSTCSIPPRYETATTIREAAVNSRITITDLDEDCDTVGDVDLYLCRIPSVSGVDCDNTLPDAGTGLGAGGYSYLNIVEDGFYSGDAVTCRYTVETPKGAEGSGNPEFFLLTDTYKLHVDATSQSTAYRVTDPLYPADSEWIYETNVQIDYPYVGAVYQPSGAQVDLGDSQVQAGGWNHGENEYIAYNHGNQQTTMEWEVTNPCIQSLFETPTECIYTDMTSCNLDADCTWLGPALSGACVQDACSAVYGTGQAWVLGTDGLPDFQIDDDEFILNSLSPPPGEGQASETGEDAEQLPNPAVTAENPTATPVHFPPAPGLIVCNDYDCTVAGGINTHWHIKPQGGLVSATFKSKITLITQ